MSFDDTQAPVLLNLSQLKELKGDSNKNVHPRKLIKALVKAGFPEPLAVEQTGNFFSSFDKLNKGSLPLTLFISEYKRMVSFQVIYALRQQSSETKSGTSYDRKAVTSEFGRRVGPAMADEIVKSLFDKVDSNKDGKLSLSEMNEWYYTMAAELKQTKEKNLTQIAKQAFDTYDKDKDGSLNKKELAYLTSSLGSTLTHAELDTAHAAMDTNGDGKITFTEFKTWFMQSKTGDYKKDFRQATILKAKLELAKASSWLATLFGQEIEGSSAIGATRCKLGMGPVADVLGRISVAYSDDTILTPEVLEDLKSQGAVTVVGTLVLAAENAVSAKLMGAVIGNFLSIIVAEGEGEEGAPIAWSTSISKADPSELYLTLGMSGDYEMQAQMVFSNIQGLAVAVETGWNLASVLNNWETIQFKDLLQAQLRFIINEVEPEILETMIRPVIIMGGGMLQIDPDEFPVFSKLLANDYDKSKELSGEINSQITSFLNDNISPMLAEFDIKTAFTETKVSEMVDIMLYRTNDSGQLDSDAFFADDESYLVMSMFKSMAYMFAHHIKEVSGVSASLIDGQGVTLEVAGLLDAPAIANMMDHIIFPDGPPVECTECCDPFLPKFVTTCAHEGCVRKLCLVDFEKNNQCDNHDSDDEESDSE